MFQLFSCSVFLVLLFCSGFGLLFSSSFSTGWALVACELFIFDSLSFYLVLLVFFLGLYSIFSFNLYISMHTKVCLLISLIFSCVCFCVNHSILFWCFYELSMLPLLYLIFFDSPYSERFIAGWYFSAYLIFTSLPLVLLLLYLSFINESVYFSCWSVNNLFWLYSLLAFVFFTKVPLVPFHTWLPIVHAEATSVVSIFLSGYIMKLGLLGVLRCCPFIFNDSFLPYLLLCGVFSIFFVLTASLELDGKRWLALLSLSHIFIPFLSFFVGSWESMVLAFLFCLGHGLSAGLVFGLLWFFYDSSNTRNWILIKSCISGNSVMFILCVSLLSLCSFPPAIQFFCEVMLYVESSFSLLLTIFWSLYLFFGGLVPLILCGHLLIRSECFESVGFSFYNFFCYFIFLAGWCYLGAFLL